MISSASMNSFGSELSKIAEKKPEKELSKKDLKQIQRGIELWNLLRKKSPVKVKIDRLADLHGGGYFDQAAKEIGMSSKDHETLAHELGHVDLDKNLIGRLLQHQIARGIFGLTPLMGAIAGASLARGRKLPLLIPVATAAPTLISERWATGKGGKRLKDAGASKKELEKYYSALSKSFSTYGATIPITLAAGLMGHVAAKV